MYFLHIFQTVQSEKLVLPEGGEKDNDSGIEDSTHRSGSSSSSKGGELTTEVRSNSVISNLSSETISFSSPSPTLWNRSYGLFSIFS